MIGGQVGPYKVESELGAGGMGTVYLAEVAAPVHGLDLGQRVALKIVHPHLLATPGFFKRFLQEAELGRKVDHENVVRTYEVDATLYEDKQVNYMAMEYVEGKSLRDLLNDLRTVPESLLREVALQIAAGLRAVHAQNIVHRDLKPENVLITADHQVRIMDLGVAKLQEASIALTKEGQFTGSLLYASPEQCEGKDVGPPADLYALGVMLYELATGMNPFRRDDAVAVIKAQISLDPPRAFERNPEISRFFSELLATLMAKDVSRRFASADELVAILTAGERSDWWQEKEKQLHTVIAELPTIQVRRETELHGREQEMRELQAAWERAKAGQGNLLFIEGEPGLGKTRVVDSFVRSLEGEDMHVLYGSYPPAGGLGGLSDAVIAKFGSAGLEENLAPYMEVTPSLIPAFAALARHESVPTGSEPLRGDALHAVVCNVMRKLAEEKPTIWVLEDLHFAPADSRKLLVSMARAVGSHRILLIATSRPGLPEEDLANLSRLEHFKRLALGRLGAREVIELLRDAFQSETLADKLGAKIAYKSDGVPFFVFEMIRGLKEGQFLAEQPDGTYVQTQMITDIEVPSAVKDLIEARLKGLDKSERAILDVAAVQGYEFDPGLIAAVLEEKKVRVLQDLAEIERRSGIVHGEAGSCRFDQYQIQEVLYKDLMPDLRTEYHALLADAFAEREELEPEETEGEDAYFMARHHLRGSRPKGALPYLEAAFEYLSGAYQLDAAVALAQRALKRKRLLTGKRRASVLHRLIQAANTLGLADAARAALEEFQALAEEIRDPALRCDALTAWASFLWNTSDFERAAATASESADLARALDDQERESTAETQLGRACERLGRFPEAMRHFERARELWERLDRLSGVAVATGNLGVIYWLLGLYEKRRQQHERCLELARESGNRSLEALVQHNLGNVFSDLGQHERALEWQDNVIALARELGYRRVEGLGITAKGEAEERRGNLPRAAEHYTEAATVMHEIGNRHNEADALLGLGRVKAQQRAESATDTLDRAIALARESHSAGTLAAALAWRAILPGGDVDAAVQALTEQDEKAPLHQKMEARFALWKLTNDRAHLEEAHRLLCELREHAPAEDRESMIENVPLNREIMAAAGGGS